MKPKLLSFIFVLCIPLSFACLNGWRQSTIYPDKCYFVSVSKKIWFEAESFCMNAAPNAHLTTIASAYETYSINAIVTDTPSISSCDQLWIGANDFDQNGQFSWSDGHPFAYYNWGAGQPDLSNQCVSSQARTTGKWKTEPCGIENCFICESYTGSVTGTTTMATTTTAAPTTMFPSTTPSTSTFFSCTTQISRTSSTSCPSSDWQYFAETNACYLIHKVHQDWFAAQQNCRSLGGNLTSVHSDCETAILASMINLGSVGTCTDWDNWYWLGGITQNEPSTNWQWSDGSSYDYTNFCKGDPDGAGQQCLMATPHDNCDDSHGPGACRAAQWIDAPCDDSPFSICKIAL